MRQPARSSATPCASGMAIATSLPVISRCCGAVGTLARQAVSPVLSIFPRCLPPRNPPNCVAKVVRTHLVDQQLLGIWRDIAVENEAAADRVLLRIDQRLRHLSEFPLMGPLRQ